MNDQFTLDRIAADLVAAADAVATGHLVHQQRRPRRCRTALRAAVDAGALPNVAGQRSPFWRYLLNSTVVGGLTALTLLMAVPAAYGIARMSSRNRGTVRTLVAAAALFPYVLLFLALLELAREFQLGNSLLAIALPYAGLALPLALLLLISAFEGLPTDLDDAARLEGLGLINRLRWVLLPLIAPAIASTGILAFRFPGTNTRSPSAG